MNIYDKIKNAAYITKCNSTGENKYIMPLYKEDFEDVYREIRLRDTFIIIDKNGDVNFYIKLKKLSFLGYLHENNNLSIRAAWNYYGPEIILNIDGLEEISGFILQLENERDIFILQSFLRKHEAYIQYIIQDEKGIIKVLTKKIQISRDFTERLKYYIELDFNRSYPRIVEEKIDNEKGYYIKTCSEIKVLEEILDTVQESKTEISNGSIKVHVEAGDFYKIIFTGDIQNIKIIFDKLLKKVNILEEGSVEVRGKPFFMYKNGLLYFFHNNIINNTGGNENECI